MPRRAVRADRQRPCGAALEPTSRTPGRFTLHEDGHGQVVAVPLDGTGPTYTGNFWFSDTESIRAVKSGDVLVEQDTDFDHVVARGSDGSKVLSNFHAHFTVNANGEVSVAFDKFRMICT